MRILVVEDQKDLNEIIVRKLTNEHYKVDSCFNGDEALAFLSCAEYDGVILDIMLPGTTGIGVLKNMRGSGDKTPVLCLQLWEQWRTVWQGLTQEQMIIL